MLVLAKYVLEMFKYYIIMKNILGFEERDKKCVKILSFSLVVFLSAYITYTENNPLLVFISVVMATMLLLFKCNQFNIIVSSIWLCFFVSILDKMFNVLIELLQYESTEIIKGDERSCLISLMTISFIGILMLVIRIKTGTYIVKFSAIYYVYFTILTIVEAIMLGSFEESINEYALTSKMYIAYILCIVILCVNIGMVMFLAVSNDGYKQRDALNNENLKQQEKYYMYMKIKNEDIRSFRHDCNAHMQTIRRYSERKKYDDLDEYVCRITEKLHMMDEYITVNNGMVDAILNQYAYESKENKVDFRVTGQLQENCFVEAYDLCTIFSNLLKNALRASKECDEKYIKIEVERKEDVVSIKVVNSYVRNIIKKDGKYITTKEDSINHGLGMANVRRSVKKYNGIFEVFDEEKEFKVYIEMYDKKCMKM